MIMLLVSVAIIAFIAWMLVQYIPMDPPFKNVIYVIAFLAILLLLLKAFGISV